MDERARALHAASIVVDGHNDVPSAIWGGYDLGHPNGKTRTDLARMKAGGLTAAFFSIYVDRVYAEHPTALGGGAARRALDLVDVVYQQIERHPQELVLATSADDIRRAKTRGMLAVLLGIEGGHAIEDSLFALRSFYRLGVRYMTLTHVNTNDWADSAGSLTPAAARHHGLAPFGEEVVREMQRIGMLVDVSHVSDETFFAVMKIARAPVIASHSSVRAIAPSRRNLTDDMLRALAANGGVAMINFYSAFVDPRYGEPNHVTRLSLVVDHIEHALDVAGEDHVGLGSDFDGTDVMPEGLESVEKLPAITKELLRRGRSEAVVKKVLGENFLRAFAAAEAYARETRTSLSGDGSTRRIPGDAR